MRVFLVGYMGSGKTRSGKLLAKGLGYAFMDIDHLFEEKYRISIQDFFRKYGEEAFRKLEHELLNDTIGHDNVVYSMGGGTPCFHNNMELLNRHGITVYIKMPAAALFSRLSGSKKQRPLIHDQCPDSLLSYIREQLAKREPFYTQAMLTVDGIGLDIGDLVKRITSMQANG